MDMSPRPWLASFLVLTAACGGSEGRVPAACGLAAVAAASTLLEQFTIPNRTLAAPPASLPERTVARVVAAGAFPAVVGRADTMLVIGVEGNPTGATPGFGVLVTWWAILRGEPGAIKEHPEAPRGTPKHPKHSDILPVRS